MFGVSILPASVQGVLLFCTPASPRYLAMKGKVDQVRGPGDPLVEEDW